MKYFCFRRQSMRAARQRRFVWAYLVFETIKFHPIIYKITITSYHLILFSVPKICAHEHLYLCVKWCIFNGSFEFLKNLEYCWILGHVNVNGYFLLFKKYIVKMTQKPMIQTSQILQIIEKFIIWQWTGCITDKNNNIIYIYDI